MVLRAVELALSNSHSLDDIRDRHYELLHGQ
jgi:hypothetical protein